MTHAGLDPDLLAMIRPPLLELQDAWSENRHNLVLTLENEHDPGRWIQAGYGFINVGIGSAAEIPEILQTVKTRYQVENHELYRDLAVAVRFPYVIDMDFVEIVCRLLSRGACSPHAEYDICYEESP